MQLNRTARSRARQSIPRCDSVQAKGVEGRTFQRLRWRRMAAAAEAGDPGLRLSAYSAALCCSLGGALPLPGPLPLPAGPPLRWLAGALEGAMGLLELPAPKMCFRVDHQPCSCSPQSWKAFAVWPSIALTTLDSIPTRLFGQPLLDTHWSLRLHRVSVLSGRICVCKLIR